MMQVGDELEGHADAGATVCVLGSTTIEGAPVTSRQRALLAALALVGSSGASITELADAVWAGRAPESARSALQNQMSRLRRAHGPRLIVCERATYRLGATTDVERFEALVTAARALPAGPTPLPLLDEAIAMWRGLPFADLTDHHAAEVERTRLIGVRASASELRSVARIITGDHGRAITDLRVEIESDPYLDRAWELLFVALQRAGRRSEAIAAHRDHVQRVRRDLGAEPSRHLMELGEALRRGDHLDLGAWGVIDQPNSVVGPTPCGHDRPRLRCQVRRPSWARHSPW